MNVTVKGIPEPVYIEIKREAKRQGRSLNAHIIRGLESEVAELRRRRRLSSVRKELDTFAASLPPIANNVPLIRQDRER